MQQRRLGPLAVSALGLGCMGMSDFYGGRDEAESDRHDPPRARARHHVPRHRRHVRRRAATRSWSGARSGTGATRSCSPPSSATSAARTARSSASTATPDYVRQACDASLKRLGRRRRSTSTTSTGSTRTRRSRTRSARWPSSCEAGKVRYLGLSEAAPADDPPRACRSIRSPRCRPNTRSGAASRRTSILADRAASWASASSPTARSAAAS